VSIDTPQDSRRLAKELEARYRGEFDFPLLEDKNHKVIDRYGILNSGGGGLPHPTTYVIDKGGVVRWRFVETDYTKRPTNEEILEALRNLG